MQRLLTQIALILVAAVAFVPAFEWAATRNESRRPAGEETALRATAGQPRQATLKADRAGHFGATAQINGRPVTVMVDTGATSVALRFEDASALGLAPDSLRFDAPVATANGLVRAARVTLREVKVGDVRVRDVEALVVPARSLTTNLLGMSFIRRLGRIEMKGDRLVLVQ